MGPPSSSGVPMCARPSGASPPRRPRSVCQRQICIPPFDSSDCTAVLQHNCPTSTPTLAGPRARVRQAKARQTAALASFDGVVLTALKETEQALVLYSAALDTRQALGDAQEKIHEAFSIAR